MSLMHEGPETEPLDTQTDDSQRLVAPLAPPVEPEAPKRWPLVVAAVVIVTVIAAGGVWWLLSSTVSQSDYDDLAAELAATEEQLSEERAELADAEAALSSVEEQLAAALASSAELQNGFDTAAEVPAGVLQVVDDYIAAMDNFDYEAFRAVTTDDFTRPEYFVDVEFGRFETGRWVRKHEYYEGMLAADPDYSISRVGDPLIYGDGPWFVSTAEVWETRTYDDDLGSGIGHKVVATYAIVDDDGVFKIADAYWAGYGRVPIDE